MVHRRLVMLVGISIWAFGCSTHHVPIRYSARVSGSSVELPEKMSVGAFVDERKTDANWLGAIRGGYGNVLKTLLTDRPASQVVEDAFREALRARRSLADRGDSLLEITGSIQKFDCNYYFNREAHARLEVEVRQQGNLPPIYSKSYRAVNEEGGIGAGIFGSVETLRQLAEVTLSEAVDEVLTDPGLLHALTAFAGAEDSRALAEPATEPGDGPERRLRTLESLREKGLVSEEEYKEKRAQILDDF